jgi:hypothetical protein
MCQLAQECRGPGLVYLIQCCIDLIKQQQPTRTVSAGNSQQHGHRHERALAARQLPQVCVPPVVVCARIC